jgi:pSer/pThr/pTyr-binding forkhead associated (FHA) protein
VVVSVDPALDVDPDPSTPCPAGEPDQVFPLDRAELLIGRRDDRRDIHPEIALHDPAASRRHAKLLLQPDGSLAVLDLDSANGTSVNGDALTPGTPHVLHGDDVLTLGRWTRIVIRGPQ